MQPGDGFAQGCAPDPLPNHVGNGVDPTLQPPVRDLNSCRTSRAARPSLISDMAITHAGTLPPGLRVEPFRGDSGWCRWVQQYPSSPPPSLYLPILISSLRDAEREIDLPRTLCQTRGWETLFIEIPAAQQTFHFSIREVKVSSCSRAFRLGPPLRRPQVSRAAPHETQIHAESASGAPGRLAGRGSAPGHRQACAAPGPQAPEKIQAQPGHVIVPVAAPLVFRDEFAARLPAPERRNRHARRPGSLANPKLPPHFAYG